MKIRIIIFGILLLASFWACDNEADLPAPPVQSMKQYFPNNFASLNEANLVKGRPLVMIMRNPDDASSQVIAENINWALNYTKIPFTSYNIETEKPFHIPASVKVICYTPTTSDSLQGSIIKQLVRFVASGNTLIITDPLWDPRMAYLEDLKPGVDYYLNKTAKGIHFRKDILPGFHNQILSGPGFALHYGLNADLFMPDIQIIASAANEEQYPVIYSHSVGDGKVFVYNTSTINDKTYRGILFSNIIEGLPGIPYLTANVSTIFLDDFPQPLYNTKEKPIKQEYNVTDAQFVTKIWWPDMVALADTFHFKYTAMTVFNYNNEVTPPYDFTQWRYAKVKIHGKMVEASPWLAAQAKRQGYEMAYHGYNHISLREKNWGTKQAMVTSIVAARKKWILAHIGPMPVTYVPPNDFIDSLGLQSLVDGMPSLKYMCSVFTDSVALGDGREFSPDPYVPSLFDYPRVTSGYTDNPHSLFDQESLYIVTGIWTHFIHPDDVYDLPSEGGEGIFAARNVRGLGWHPFGKHKLGLYEVFKGRLKKSFRINPLLRIKPAKFAVPIVKKWRSSRVDRINHKSIVEINYQNYFHKKDTTLKYWYVYVPDYAKDIYQNLIRKQGIDYGKVKLWNGYLFEFNTHRNELFFPKVHAPEPVKQAIVSNVADTAVIQYQNYHTVKDTVYADEVKQDVSDPRLRIARQALKRHPGSRVIQDRVIKLGVEFNKVDISISVLEYRLLHENIWQKHSVDLMMKYYSWQNEDNRIWMFLKRRWDTYPDLQSVSMEKYISDKTGVPNDQFSKLWLKREMKLRPGDMKLKAKYAYLYQSQQEWPLVKKYLKELIHHNPDSDTLYHFALQHSFWYDKPDTTLKWLERFPATSYPQLKPFYGDIANLYAYTANNISLAIIWAERDPKFDKRTILDWYLDQKRYSDFESLSDSLLKKHPQDDSLRTYVGSAYLDNGYDDSAFHTLYPLFEKEKISSSLATSIQKEISYLSYDRQKKLYIKYPDMFRGKNRSGLRYEHRIEEGFQPGILASYSTDNFKNTLAKTEISGSWGNRLDHVNTITTGYDYVSSDINKLSRSSGLQEIRYGYTKYYQDQKYQLNAGAGVVRLSGNGFLPDLTTGFSYSATSTYSSLTAELSPVYTNVGVNRKYNKINLNFYNEVNFLNRHLGTSESFTGNRYSNNVYSWELDGHFYVSPWAKGYFHVKPEIMYSYSSATKNYSSGVPYWTPHNLNIEGVGVTWTYNKENLIPKFTMDGEMLLNNDNQNGLYYSANINLNALILKYWRLGLKGDVSTSKVYRSNSVTLSISYVFPKGFR